MNNNSKDRLYLFVVISLVIHLGLFYFVPWGGFATGLNPEGRTREEFEFIQFVDFEEIPQAGQEIEVEEETPVEESSPEEVVEEEVTEQEPETESEPETEEAEEDLAAEQPEESEDTTSVEDEEVSEEVEEDILTVEDSEEEIDTDSSPEEDTIQVEETAENQEESASSEEVAEDVTGSEEDEIEEEAEAEDTSPPPAGELVISSQEPVYPKYSVGPGETGEVIISAKVDIDGEIIEVSVSDSSGVEAMDRNAQNTIEHGWDFNSYSSQYTMDIQVNYSLDERGDPVINYELLEIRLD